jgi:cytochrome P450
MEDKKNEDFFEKAGHRTIFHELINSEILPPAEKQTLRVIQEAGAMVGAGGESTSQVLTALTYCLIADQDKLRKLREELRTIMPDSDSPMPSLKQLEKLPYLVCTTILCASSNSMAKRRLIK